MLEIFIFFAFGIFGFWGLTVFVLAFKNKSMLVRNKGGTMWKPTGIFSQIYSFFLILFFIYVIGFFNIFPILNYWNSGGAIILMGDILIMSLGIYLGKKTYKRNLKFDVEKYNKFNTKFTKKYRLYGLLIILILILYMIGER